MMVRRIYFSAHGRRQFRHQDRYGGISLTRNYQPPQDHHRALGIGLLLVPRGARFLVSEVPLYAS